MHSTLDMIYCHHAWKVASHHNPHWHLFVVRLVAFTNTKHYWLNLQQVKGRPTWHFSSAFWIPSCLSCPGSSASFGQPPVQPLHTAPRRLQPSQYDDVSAGPFSSKWKVSAIARSLWALYKLLLINILHHYRIGFIIIDPNACATFKEYYLGL